MTRTRATSADEGKQHRLLRRLRESLGRYLPERTQIAGHPMLKPIARHILSPRLWHLQHEAVARGLAIGLFWAFVMPLGQIPVAVAHCIWWRANIPVAVAATLVTNPLTLGFWLWAAYGTGTLFLDAPPLVMPGQGTVLIDWFQSMGRPVMLGMLLFAVCGSTSAYIAAKLLWRWRVGWLWRQRRGHSKPRQSAP
jgi:uncharacterized protein